MQNSQFPALSVLNTANIQKQVTRTFLAKFQGIFKNEFLRFSFLL
jgi:hypothetical protein